MHKNQPAISETASRTSGSRSSYEKWYLFSFISLIAEGSEEDREGTEEERTGRRTQECENKEIEGRIMGC